MSHTAGTAAGSVATVTPSHSSPPSKLGDAVYHG